MDLVSSMHISASGLSAHRVRMNVISMNMANVNTTRTKEGGPYSRKITIHEAVPFKEHLIRSAASRDVAEQESGVNVMDIVESDDPFRMVFDPAHPDANEDGYVAYPNVNIVTEMVNMMTAVRAYEANVTAINAAKEMALKALEIGR